MSPQTVVADPADNLTLSLSLISFPAPFSLVLVRNQNNEIIHRSNVSFAPTEVTLSAFGRVVKLYGYSCRLNMPNITREWFGTNSIIVFNRLGNYSLSFTVEEFSDRENFIGKIYQFSFKKLNFLWLNN